LIWWLASMSWNQWELTRVEVDDVGIVVKFARGGAANWNSWSNRCHHLSVVWLDFEQIWQNRHDELEKITHWQSHK
jgi:hypothetical protein